MDERLVTQAAAVSVSLERHLGDPFDASSPCSFRRSVDFDEGEEFPAPLCARAFEWGVHEYFVPRGAGGKLVACEDALALLRLLARRDLTVAIALGSTFLGAVHGWLAGSAAQKARLAALIAERKFISFALSERLHGSDVLSGEVVAHRAEGGFLLSGEKWSINNATQSAALLVFAKTQAAGGSRGFTLLLVDKERLQPGTYRYLAKIPTLGIRGADISGIAFDNAFVPDDAVIGGQGAGLEIGLKGLMVTRALCAGLSLGAADTALRTTLRFAVERRLYGRSVFEIPAARRALVAAFGDLLLCDCLALTGARALHVMPDQASLWSAVIKYLVPTIVEGSLRDLAAVLGARYYMRREFADGIFQKMLRDNFVVGLFDGSTAVNLHSLATQLPSLAGAGALRSGAAGALGARLRSVFSVDAPVPPFETLRLSLVARGANDIQAGAALLPDALRGSAAGDRRARDEAAALLQQIVDALAADERRWRAAPRDSVELFEAARRYCVYHAAVACTQFWLYSGDALEPFYREPHWLNVSLGRLSTMVGGVAPVHSSSWDALAAQLLGLFEANRLFSIRPHPLAPIRD